VPILTESMQGRGAQGRTLPWNSQPCVSPRNPSLSASAKWQSFKSRRYATRIQACGDRAGVLECASMISQDACAFMDLRRFLKILLVLPHTAAEISCNRCPMITALGETLRPSTSERDSGAAEPRSMRLRWEVRLELSCCGLPCAPGNG
jgi:hypothetical protein